jgi:hypothetical protein
MTMRLWHGGVCEPSIRCLMAPAPLPTGMQGAGLWGAAEHTCIQCVSFLHKVHVICRPNPHPTLTPPSPSPQRTLWAPHPLQYEPAHTCACVHKFMLCLPLWVPQAHRGLGIPPMGLAAVLTAPPHPQPPSSPPHRPFCDLVFATEPGRCTRQTMARSPGTEQWCLHSHSVLVDPMVLCVQMTCLLRSRGRGGLQLPRPLGGGWAPLV